MEISYIYYTLEPFHHRMSDFKGPIDNQVWPSLT